MRDQGYGKENESKMLAIKIRNRVAINGGISVLNNDELFIMENGETHVYRVTYEFGSYYALMPEL